MAGGRPTKGADNLRPCRDTDTAKARGKLGGIKSGEAKREKKRLSEMYADILAKGFMVDGDRLTLDEVVSSIMDRKDSASVSMLKEIREATEGTKSQLTIETYAMTPEERKARLVELETERLNDGK